MIRIPKKLKSALALLLMLAVVGSLPCALGCNDSDPDGSDPDEPGAEFTGSITDKGDNADDGGDDAEDEDIGDETQTYHISTAEDMRTVLKLKGTYVLDADIDLSGEDWTPIGTYGSPFVGTFEGNGHTVSGLTLKNVTAEDKDAGLCLSYQYYYLALFGCTENAKINDLTVSGVDISYDTNSANTVVYAAAISAFSRGTKFNGCTVNGGSITVSSKSFKACSGGIVGAAYSSSVKRCNAKDMRLSVTASTYSSTVGGMLGHAGSDVSIYGCTVSGTLSATSQSGNAYCGGVAGYISNSRIEKCSSSAAVTSVTASDTYNAETACSAIAGGLVAYCGGIGGATEDGTDNDEASEAEQSSADEKRGISEIKYSYSTGAVTATSKYQAAHAGGIIGKQAFTDVTDSYSVSNVYAESIYKDVYAGGFTAYAGSSSTYKGTFFAGKTVKAISTNGTANCGIALGNATSKDEADDICDRCGYLDTAQVSANGKATELTDRDGVLEGYMSSDISSLSVLIAHMGWNASEWKNNLGGYPQIKLPEA